MRTRRMPAVELSAQRYVPTFSQRAGSMLVHGPVVWSRVSTRRRRMPTKERNDLLQPGPVLELPGWVRVPVPRELSRSALRTQARVPGHAAVLEPWPVSAGR